MKIFDKINENRSFTTIVLAGLLLLAVILTYYPVLKSQAFSFDDHQYIFTNNLVKNPGFNSIWRFFSEILTPSSVQGYYQPITMTALMLDYFLGGTETNLAVFHLSNLVLHIGNTLLLFMFLNMLIKNHFAAFFSSLIFGIHAVGVEPVAWISEKKTLLSLFFLLIAFIFYLKYIDSTKPELEESQLVGITRKHYLFYALFTISFMASMLSKPISLTFPVLLILLDFWPLKRVSKKTLLEKIPIFIVSVCFSVISYISQSRTAGDLITSSKTLQEIVWKFFYNTTYYLVHLFYPGEISVYNPYPKNFNLLDFEFIKSFLFISLVVALVFYSAKFTRSIIMGSLFFIFAMLPTLGITTVTDSIVNFKYAYYPLIGLLIILCQLISWWLEKSKNKVILPISILLVLSSTFLFVGTRNYISKWKDSETLASHMLKIYPSLPHLLNFKGFVVLNSGKTNEALSIFHKSYQINNNLFETMWYLGLTHTKLNDHKGALALFQKAYKLQPNGIKNIYNLSLLYIKTSQPTKAIPLLKSIIARKPNFDDAKTELLSLYINIGNLSEAEALGQKYINEHFENSRFYAQLASLYIHKQQFDKALFWSNKSIKFNPNYYEGYVAYANILFLNNKYAESEKFYRKATLLSPENVKVLNNYGVCLAAQGKLDDALLIFEKSQKIDPTNEETAKYIKKVKQQKP